MIKATKYQGLKCPRCLKFYDFEREMEYDAVRGNVVCTVCSWALQEYDKINRNRIKLKFVPKAIKFYWDKFFLVLSTVGLRDWLKARHQLKTLMQGK